MPRSTGRRALSLATTLALTSTALALTPAEYANAATSLTQNSATKTVTATSGDISITVAYNGRAAITSLRLAGTETLTPGTPGHTSIEFDADGSKLSSLTPTGNPTVSVSGNTATLAFEMSNTRATVSETWTLRADASDVDLEISRTLDWAGATSGAVRDSQLPQLTFQREIWENAHLAQSGGSLPLWGDQLVEAAAAELTDGSPAFPNGLSLETAGNRVVQTQNQLRLLGTGDLGLDISANPSRKGAISFLREGSSSAPAGLTTSWSQSNPAWTFKNGNPKGYAEPVSLGGRFATQRALLFAPVSVVDGQTDSISLSFASTPTSDAYDVGDIKGFNSRQVAHAIKDFGAAMMQDSTIGASSERSFRSAKAAPFTMLFNIYVAELLQSKAAFESLQEQYLDVKNGLQRADGMIECCTPFEVEPIPANLPDYLVTDGIFAYVASAAELYELYPDDTWLAQMKPSIQAALAYADANLKVTSGITAGLYSNYQCGQPAPLTGCVKHNSDWNDLYQIGQVNAYQNVLAYHALTEWAELEEEVLGDSASAAAHRSSAATLKAKYNQAGPDGGFWSPTANSFGYTRDTNGALVKNCLNLFANGYAIQYGLVNADRARLIAGQLEDAYASTFWRLHGSNPVTCRTTETDLYFPYFEDGGVHLLMEQPASQIGLTLSDRSRNVNFARTVSERYPQDEFWGMSNIQPDTLNVRRDVYQETWMSNNAVGLWPLFHDVLGIQPTRDRLDLVPYIDNSLIGTEVPYTVWGQHKVTVSYQGIETYRVTSNPSVPTRVGWRDKQPGRQYTARIDGNPQSVTADASGKVWIAAPSTGTHTYSIDNTSTTTHDHTEATYRGTWGPAGGSAFFGGSIALSSSANSTASFDFTGDSISFTGSTGTDKGQANISVDGINLGTVDYFSTNPQNQKLIFSQTGFGPGTHRLTITALGTKNASSTGTQVNIDAFQLAGTPPTKDVVDDVHFRYGGGWFTDQNGRFLNETIHGSVTAGSSATRSFRGSMVEVIGTKGPDKGRAQIVIDNGAPQIVDLYSPTVQHQSVLTSIGGLSNGNHTIQINVLGTKTAASTGVQVNLDGLRVGQ